MYAFHLTTKGRKTPGRKAGGKWGEISPKGALGGKGSKVQRVTSAATMRRGESPWRRKILGAQRKEGRVFVLYWTEVQERVFSKNENGKAGSQVVEETAKGGRMVREK